MLHRILINTASAPFDMTNSNFVARHPTLLSMLMLLCASPSPCRAQRTSLVGWRTWWRCTRLVSEMWRSWQAWICTGELPGATLKSSRSRPTCTPTRARSDLCWLVYVTDLFQPWWTYVVLGRDEIISVTLTYTSFSSAAALRCPCCGRFTEQSYSFHLLRHSFNTTELLASLHFSSFCSAAGKQDSPSALSLFHCRHSYSVKWHHTERNLQIKNKGHTFSMILWFHEQTEYIHQGLQLN